MAGVSSTQASAIIREVALGLVNRAKDHIKWPTATEMRQLADENNEEFGLPDCPLGVDGKLASCMLQVSVSKWIHICIALSV